jgi:hypothetical protein
MDGVTRAFYLDLGTVDGMDGATHAPKRTLLITDRWTTRNIPSQFSHLSSRWSGVLGSWLWGMVLAYSLRKSCICGCRGLRWKVSCLMSCGFSCFLVLSGFFSISYFLYLSTVFVCPTVQTTGWDWQGVESFGSASFFSSPKRMGKTRCCSLIFSLISGEGVQKEGGNLFWGFRGKFGRRSKNQQKATGVAYVQARSLSSIFPFLSESWAGIAV